MPPRIVAESLEAVRDAGATALRCGPRSPVDQVARSIARGLLPPTGDQPVPEWLRPDQAPLFQRIVAALHRHGGALLAAPVGSGKTWVALAVAREVNGPGTTTVLAPPTLLPHWRRTAASLGVVIDALSLAQASRGRLAAGSSLVIIDESHNLRNPLTRRHGTVARWLVGRRALLLSATPVVNRLDDLATQLLLTVRDDTLAPSGVGSIVAILASGEGHPALDELVITGPDPPGGTIAPLLPIEDEESPLARQIDTLELASDQSVAALLRRVFWRAAASSPAALAETAAAYERLLGHGADAAAAGRQVTRQDVRRFTGADDTQLVLWELVAAEGIATLSLKDLGVLPCLRQLASDAARQDDARVIALRRLLADGVPSLIFITRRATVRYLRDRLGGARVAWCMGAIAGIGMQRAPRSTVLDWFRSNRPIHAHAPVHLITTDVASEGLDLGRLSRVVHYDLPWTPARLEQREGRSRRGERAALATAISIPPPPMLEQRLGLSALLDAKRVLPGKVDIRGRDGTPWRWRDALMRELGPGEAVNGVATVVGESPCVLAGVEIIEAVLDGELVVGRVLAGIAPDERGLGEVEAARHLQRVATAVSAPGPSRAERGAALHMVAQAVRALLRQHEAAAWWRRSDPMTRTLLDRLFQLARTASRARDRAALGTIEQAIRFVGGGHTSGERQLLRDLAVKPTPELLASLSRLPPPSTHGGGLLTARLTGLIIVRHHPDDGTA